MLKIVAGVLVIIVSLVLEAYPLSVKDVSCGVGVKNREVIKPADEFKDVKRIWCLVELRDIEKPTVITTRWVFNGRYFDVKLPIKPYRRFRTWSYKTIYPSMKGVWKFEVIDEKGNLLKEKVFIIK